MAAVHSDLCGIVPYSNLFYECYMGAYFVWQAIDRSSFMHHPKKELLILIFNQATYV